MDLVQFNDDKKSDGTDMKTSLWSSGTNVFHPKGRSERDLDSFFFDSEGGHGSLIDW